jgi:serine/threonine-protein kinase
MGPSRYGAGDVIAERYRLGRKLGEGGMGEVWLAHNETLDIDVAIKLIRGDMATPEMAERLLHEARAAARLGHPAIVRVNDFGTTNRNDPFIVMELLDGEDLASTLAKRGRLSPIKAMRTLLPIAHALVTAHTKGIVHRDLKPENVFLARSDDGQIQPKLVDFGVAKLEKHHTIVANAGRLTQSGALLGSPLYMSPEQARGDDVDHRADIWAFAVVIYEAIAGRPPFDGKNYNAVIYSIIANPPTPITDLGVGDAELWSILDRGFQKDPDRRWYSMRDFGEALARWLVDRNITEDITGASLPTTWLQWKKDEDALATATEPTEDEQKALPPVPHLMPGAGVRAREITLRTRRTKTRRATALAAATGGGAFVLLVLGWLVFRSPSDGAPSDTTAAKVSPSALPPTQAVAEPETEKEHERAVEEALASDVAGAPGAKTRSTAKKTRPAGESRKPAPTMSKGIRSTDPYGKPGQRPATLKNPFQ